MDNRIKAINDYMAHFSQADIDRVYDFTIGLAQLNTYPRDRPSCPLCSGFQVIKYGFKGGKQRFFCKECHQTFMHTTNTVMSHSRYDRATWHAFIKDTLAGCSLDESAEKLGFSHQTAFTMRHKVLTALLQSMEKGSEELSGICELDETYVLDCYKGAKLPESVSREPRKHGAKAMKKGLSNEQVCICAGVQRQGNAIATTVNRAHPSKEELQKAFSSHIASGSLVLVDGLKGYDSLETVVDCSVKNIHTEENHSMYNLNTINNFHSFIKERYNRYRGVATKYINRYNVLFSTVYRNLSESIDYVFATLCNTGSSQHWNAGKSLDSKALAAI